MKTSLLFVTLLSLNSIQTGETATAGERAAQIVQSQKNLSKLLQLLAQKSTPENIVGLGAGKSMESCGVYHPLPTQSKNNTTPNPDRDTPSPETQDLITELQQEYEKLRTAQEEFKQLKKTDHN